MEITGNTIMEIDWENYILHGIHAQLCYHLFQILPWDHKALQYHLNRRNQLAETGQSAFSKLSSVVPSDQLYGWFYKIRDWTYASQNFGGEPKGNINVLIESFKSCI